MSKVTKHYKEVSMMNFSFSKQKYSATVARFISREYTPRHTDGSPKTSKYLHVFGALGSLFAERGLRVRRYHKRDISSSQ